MHTPVNLEVDWLQQQKSTKRYSLVSQEQESEDSEDTEGAGSQEPDS